MSAEMHGDVWRPDALDLVYDEMRKFCPVCGAQLNILGGCTDVYLHTAGLEGYPVEDE